MTRQQVREMMGDAFRGVTLDGGVSLRQGEVMDNRGRDSDGREISERKFRALGFEEVSDWTALSQETLERLHYLSFLDAKGYRFYIPAFAISLLFRYETSSMRVITTLGSLYPKRDNLWEYHMVQYSLLNQEQRHAIAAVLFCLPSLVELSLDDQKVVARALRNYWHEYLSTCAEICYTLRTMSRLTRIDLSVEERRALEHGFRHGKTHGFRQRCQMVLLKEQRKSSEAIGHQLGYCEAVVNQWVKRYQSGGLEALHIRKGRGRKAILSSTQDLPAVRRAVQANRQRLSLAQAALQGELDKRFSQSTLKRFLKNIIADTSDCVGG